MKLVFELTEDRVVDGAARTREQMNSLALHLLHGDERAGKSGGGEHFGIRPRPEELDDAIAAVAAAGGALVERGEHPSGVPYTYVREPDGHVMEI